MNRSQALRLLGLSEGFTITELDHAFRTMAFAHHPDRGGDPEAMKRIVEAKGLLSLPAPTPNQPSVPEASQHPRPPDEPMDRVSFATVSFVLLIPVVVLGALLIMTLVGLSAAR